MDPKVKPTPDELAILETCDMVHAMLVRAWKFAPDGFVRDLVAEAIHELEGELDLWEAPPFDDSGVLWIDC